MDSAWRVVGENGVLVREEATLTSPELGRLPCGAIVLQQELRGERLGFRLLRGLGPARGYVSLKIKGKELLERCQLTVPETPIPHASLEVVMPRNCMKTWSPLRRVANFRPLEAPKLRPGKLYRSGHLAAASPEDLKYLESLGLQTYVDLRDGTDFEGADAPAYVLFPPSPRSNATVSTGRRRIACPFSKDLKIRPWTAEEKAKTVAQQHRQAWTSWWYQRLIRMSMEKKVDLNIATNLCALNRAILFVNSDEVVRALRIFTEEENYPIVFGCVAGKDRTGLLACLILSALGMDKETIMRDYLTTNEAAEHINACVQVGMALWWKQLEAEDPRRYQMMVRNGQVGALQYDISWPGPKGEARGAPAVYPATMAYTCELLEEEGGAAAYLSRLGFGDEELAKLRQILLEDP